MNLAPLDLSSSDRKLVALITDGLSNAEIALALGLTEGTIKNRVSEILRKNGLQNRTGLAIAFLKAQLAERPAFRPE
ncbi:MAG: response regulator transcription factor [Beijerinckiaceae bacterium]